MLLTSDVSPLLHKRLSITIQNNEGFYYLQDGRQHKTGFGTSSTTTVAFVSCLLIALNRVRCVLVMTLTPSIPPSQDDLKRIASIATQAHQQAQHKSGSGYDITTGVYGSCVFEMRRDHTPFSMPAGLSLLLSQGGAKSSSTPELVKRMQSWRKDASWETYRRNNEDLINALTMRDCAALHGLFLEKLDVMYAISSASGCAIVPSELYPVLKETMAIPGVVGCAVAGAGGFDSFYALVDATCDIKAVEKRWQRDGYSISTVVEDDCGMTIR